MSCHNTVYWRHSALRLMHVQKGLFLNFEQKDGGVVILASMHTSTTMRFSKVVTI